MTGLAKRVATVLAFTGKELVEVMRRPGALVSLVLGPFAIMVLFGLGFYGFPPAREAVLVVPSNADLPADVADWADAAPGIEVVEVVNELERAEARLHARDVDLVIMAPDDLATDVIAGEQPVVEVLINETDPVAHNNATYLAALFSSELNRRIIEEAVREGQTRAAESGVSDAGRVSPEAIAQPTRSEVKNVAPMEPSVMAFYGAAMIAFVLQHLSVSLMGLSLIRERANGSFELFRVAPVGPTEIVLGKVLAFTLMGAAVAGALAVLLVQGLGVPMAGDPLELALTLGLLIIASLGVGVVIAMVSDSERQVVQLALLILLASIFFTGFVLNPELFYPVVQPVMYLLPATHGIALTRDLMFYGWAQSPAQLLILASMALVLLVAGSSLLRRRIAQT